MALCPCLAADNAVKSIDTLRGEFANPSNEFRAKPLNQKKYKDGQALVDDLKAGRWGGVLEEFPSGYAYLKDEKGWKKYSDQLASLKAAGMTNWIYDEQGYPSGRAGGLVLAGHPEWEAQGLFYAHTFIKSGGAGKDPQEISWKLPEGTPYYIVAYPLAQNALDIDGDPVDLTSSAKDGQLKTTLPQSTWGQWRLMAFVQNRLFTGTHAPITGGKPYINVLDPEAVKRFIEVTHEAYYANCGAEFGKTITAAFTDEVSLMTGYLTDTVQPHQAIAWYHGLPSLFKARTGRDLRACLPTLVDDTMPEATQMRCAFYDMLGQQVAASYYKQIREWCAAHNIAFIGHLLWEENLIYHVNFYGTAFPSLKELDWPGIDVLWCKYGQAAGSHTDGGAVTPKLASSAAHLWNRPRVLSESFWDTKRDKVTIDEVISHYSWQAAMGVSTLTTITVQDQYPVEELARFNEAVGRLNAVLTQGTFTADVAILYPIASVWSGFKPTQRHIHFHSDNPLADQVDRAWRSATEEALAQQRDFDYIDEDTLREASVGNGQLKLGSNKYSLLILPNITTLSLASLQQIQRFVKDGGTVLSYQTVPSQQSDFGPDQKFQALVQELWGSSHERVIHAVNSFALGKALQNHGTPDLKVVPAHRAVNYQHRVLEKSDIYYLINNDKAQVEGSFTFRAKGKVEIWNPFDGTTTSATAESTSHGSSLLLTLPPRKGLFVMFSRE